ncbi:muscle, skeletal receptor tyrosine protein kinase-like [Patiria miniata]|uniref:receptor protein-tyrosine kinase n=1 Tax=Patiria miniata TaxID=46514 RepID=A0A914BHH7_PATMI|nr:muscle, skeletal receptor tyrosine protein kinase-like [Patiria miniata]
MKSGWFSVARRSGGTPWAWRSSMATPESKRRNVAMNGARADHRWAWRYRSAVGGLQIVVIFCLLSPASSAPTATIVPSSSAAPDNLTTPAITDLTQQHTSEVKQISENPRQPGNVQVPLEITRQPIEPPSIQRGPENKTVAVGGRVTFRCQPVGQGLEVTWVKDGHDIPRNSSQYIIKSNFNLRIPSISTSDGGVYQCRALNAGGEVYSSPAFLDVQIPAQIPGEQQTIDVSYGAAVNLTCAATGNPKPTFSWTKNTDFVKNEETHPPTYWVKQYLTFNASKSLNYTCLARNKVLQQDGREKDYVSTMHYNVRVHGIPSFCASYGGNICKNYLSGRSVFVDANFYDPHNRMEPVLKRLTDHVDSIVMDSTCREAFKSLVCHSMLPDCKNSRLQPLCREDCLTVRSDLCYRDWRNLKLRLSSDERIKQKLGPLAGLSQCQDLPSKEAAPGSCSDAGLFEMRDDKRTWDCVDNSNDGMYYQGNISVTKTGLTCQQWATSYPQSRRMFASVYPQLVNSSNYCRNPGGRYSEPGCFPNGGETEWQSCKIPSCDVTTEASPTTAPQQSSTTATAEEKHAITDTPYVHPVPMEPNSNRDIYLICGGAFVGVCFVCIIVGTVLFCRFKFNRYSRYKFPGDLDVSKLPENPMYGKDFNKSFNPHLRHLEYPRNNIIYIVDIGEGAFGRVFKAIAPKLRPEEASTTVAVKMLKTNADRDVQEYFNREAEIIARFDNPNVIKLLGVCFVGKPLCILLEYMGQGDLQEFLHYHNPDQSQQGGPGGALRINSRTQLNLAYQVACGMVYLTEKRFVHRDIATRNCLVGNNNEVKISDFGLARYLGSSDHFLGHKDETIPIRWTSPEALWHYKFTTYSDVWSFGVLLWEIFSFARQPYESMTHEEVFLQTYKGHTLECPDNTPHCVYELIQMCCSQDLNARPSFYTLRDTLNSMQDSELVC